MILVIGATGVVGREVVPRVLEYGQTVRAMSRSPEKARPLFDSTVELVRGDIEDSASLRAALADVERVFLVTPSIGGQPPDAAICALALQAGARQIVRMSVLQAGGDENDPMTGWHTTAESAIKASGLAWTFLRPGGFMSNTLGWSEMIRRDHTARAVRGSAGGVDRPGRHRSGRRPRPHRGWARWPGVPPLGPGSAQPA